MTRGNGSFSSRHVFSFVAPNRQTVGSKIPPFFAAFSGAKSQSKQNGEERGFRSSEQEAPIQLLRKVVDYLKSDTFMYAPLISSPQSEFLPLGTIHSSTKVVQFKKLMKEKKRFAEQVAENLKSDVYMYAPLVVPPHSPLEPVEYDRMRRKDLSSRRLTMNGNHPTYDLENVNQRSSHIPVTDLSNQHTLGLKETMKHSVYQNCRSTSASGNVTAT